MWLQFNPQSGHEQAGHRPALVLSTANYNRVSGFDALLSHDQPEKKGYPFEVVISDDPQRLSVVLADQVKSLDWKARKAVKEGTASLNVVMETLSKLQTLL